MNESKATRYQRLRRRASALGIVSAGVTLSLIALTPASAWLRTFAVEVSGNAGSYGGSALALLVFVSILVLLGEIAALPAAMYVAFVVDRAFGQSQVSPAELFRAQLGASAIAAPAAIVAGGVVVASVSIAGPWWWGVSTVLLTAGLVAAVDLGPLLLARLASVRPIVRPVLSETLDRIATRVGTRVEGVDEWMLGEGASATALVAGVGRHRRVLVSSELARHWSDDEIAVVVAHELAHHAYHDVWRTTALNAGVVAAGLLLSDVVQRAVAAKLDIRGPADLAALPLIGLVVAVVWLLATPLRHAQSRRQERRADVFALAMTDGVDAFQRAIRRLSAKHLAEEDPSRLSRWLFHRHPPVSERLALAEAYSRIRRARPGD